MLNNRFVQTGSGITLHYKIDGAADGVPLIFINSLGTDLRIWDDVVPHFEQAFRIIRFDKRGHGLSDCPPAPYSIRDFTNDLVSLMDALEIDKAILVGLSVGGMIAIDAAAAYPERVEVLILSDTAPKIGTVEGWNERIDTLRSHDMPYLSETIVKRWFTPEFDSRHTAAWRGYVNMLNRMPVEGYTGTCEAIRDADLRDQAQSITKETLVICGAQDASTPPEFVEANSHLLPNSRFHLIEGSGHLPCVEQPDETAAVIRQFLKENMYA